MSQGVRKEHEQAFGEVVGARHARALSRARQALLVLLKAMGVGPGDRVGVCGFSCVAVTEAVRLTGARAAYMDVEEHVCIDPEAILREGRGGLKVVILQHTFGIPGRLDELIEACRGVGASVVEDCAHALGGTWKGKPLGSFGEGAIYSTGWGKPCEMGRGGMLTVNSEALLEKVDEEIERWGLAESRAVEATSAWERRIHDAFIGLGAERTLRAIAGQMWRRGLRGERSEQENGWRLYRGYVRIPGEAQCRVGLKRLGDWPATRARRVANAEWIEGRLRGAGVATWPVPTEAEPVMMSYPVRVADKRRVMELAQRRGVGLLGHYETPVHPLWGEELAEAGYELGWCPRAEEETDRLVHISTAGDDIAQGVEMLIRFGGQSGSMRTKGS